MKIVNIFILLVFSLGILSGYSETIGTVDTTFNLIGKNDQLTIESFDDPLIKNVTCYISRPIKGGIKGGLGIAEETSDSSISCRQVGQIQDSEISDLKEFEKAGKKLKGKKAIAFRSVFKEDTNLFFKNTYVVRFFDERKNVIIYMSFARELIDGSPKSSISVVPILSD